MKLEQVYLADYATKHPDGRWTIVGGHIREIQAQSFPLDYPSLYLVLRFAFDSEDTGRAFQYRVSVRDSSGKVLLQPIRIEVRPSGSRGDTELQVAIRLAGVTFDSAGNYEFALDSPDGEAQGAVIVGVSRPPGNAAGDEAAVALNDGFVAFARGDHARAEGVFRRLVEQNPVFAPAYNNLAFVQMARGDWAAALANLEEAGTLGFVRQELMDLNIGCCEYQLGRPADSLPRFQHCLHSHVFLGSALLFALGIETRVVDVGSASDYAALAALNAAWSAHTSGQSELARRYSGQAGTADIALDDDRPGHAAFSASLGELQAGLGSA